MGNRQHFLGAVHQIWVLEYLSIPSGFCPKLWITREKLWKTMLNWGKVIHFPEIALVLKPPYMGGVRDISPNIKKDGHAVEKA